MQALLCRNFLPNRGKKGEEKEEEERGRRGDFRPPPRPRPHNFMGSSSSFLSSGAILRRDLSAVRPTELLPPPLLAIPFLLTCCLWLPTGTHTQPRKKRRRRRSESHLISRPQPFPPFFSRGEFKAPLWGTVARKKKKKGGGIRGHRPKNSLEDKILAIREGDYKNCFREGEGRHLLGYGKDTRRKFSFSRFFHKNIEKSLF